MMKSSWRILNFAFPEELPQEGQDIYFSISEGEGFPFQPAGKTTVELAVFQDILETNPSWLFIWQPIPPPPPVPVHYLVQQSRRGAGNTGGLHLDICEEEGHDS